MASKYSLERKCESINRKNRLVNERYSINLNKFVNDSRGNFYISGNRIDLRNNILLSFIRKLSRENPYPILVLSNSGNSEQINNLIKADIQTKEIQRNRIAYTSQSPTYDPLYDLTPKKLKAIIRKIAISDNYSNIPKILSYYDAIINVLNKINQKQPYPFRQLIKQDNSRIEEMGRQYGASSNAIDDIFNYREEDPALKQIIDKIYSAFKRISTKKSSNPHSISNLLNERRVIILEYNSSEQEVFDLILNKILIDYNKPINLVFDNINLSSDSPLIDSVTTLKNISGTNIGISTQDIMSWISPHDTKKNISLKEFPTKFVDLNSMAQISVNEYLEQFGKYQEAYVTEGYHKESFHFFGDNNWTLAYKPANRIKLEDIPSHPILLTGHNGLVVELVENVS